ncbi:MAG: ATP-binding protein [Nitrospirae bacterium]|nr:ATP-binding protein [Nitrospirota bacterium]
MYIDGTLQSYPNPCPCGYLSDPRHQCSCAPGHIQRYRRRVSGPLLDRIDIHLEVPDVPYKELSSEYSGEKSLDIRTRVVNTRNRQLTRLKGDRIYCTSYGYH